MPFSARLLGALAIAGAPFLWVETHLYSEAGRHNTSLTGLCDLLYMLGWAASVLVLLRRRAAGQSRVGRLVLGIQLGLLALACIGNVWVIADPATTGPLYRVFDLCWPISNCWMIVVGIGVLRARRLPGWQRYVPLVVGGWLPVTALLGTTLGESPVMYYGMVGYSLLAWLAMGVVAYLGGRPARARRPEEPFLAHGLLPAGR